jgi:drug/metabolite transporter (DMT)-like permease
VAAFCALAASAAWGVADFVGGVKSRVLHVLAVMLAGQLAGLLTIGTVVAVRGIGPAEPGVALAAPAALAGTLGVLAFYRSMAVGVISIVAPIAAVSTVIPVAVGLIGGERPSSVQGAGMALTIVGVALAAREPAEDGPRRFATGAGLALVAAVGFGSYFPVMHAAAQHDVVWSVLVFRLTSVTLVASAALVVRPTLRPAGQLGWGAAVGILDTLGNFAFAAASARGLVSLVSVLASLYPIVTVALAQLVLGERITPSQAAGATATLAGVVLISA